MLHLPCPLPIDAAWLPPELRETAIGKRYRVRFSAAEKRSLIKKAYVRPSDWCERHIVLPADAPIPGRWRNRNMPHVAGILDASFHPGVREIVCCWAPQTAKTSLGFNAIGYAMDRVPGNFLCVFPDIKTSKETIQDRLTQLFKDSPRLRTYLTGYEDDVSTSRIKLAHRKIYVGWASSIASMAAKPLPYVILDEEDKFEWSTKETTPPNLVRKRLTRFSHMSKLWRFSSPSVESGPIWKALNEECDVIFDYHVRCPACGAFQVMAFGGRDTDHGIKWEGGTGADPKQIEKHRLAWYVCPRCKARWDDAMRDQAARAGQWRDREKGVSIEAYLAHFTPRVIGSHMPAWQSPEVSMSKAAAQFIKGQKDIEELKDFNNGFAALPWKPAQRDRKISEIVGLRDERPEGKVPGAGRVAVITFGVDTQGDDATGDLWYVIRAWGYGIDPDSWLIRAGKVTSKEALVTVLWRSEYCDVEGNRYPVLFGLQDAMGHRTDEVYDFCASYRGYILPYQGVDRMVPKYAESPIEFFPGSRKAIPGGIKLLRVNTTYFKGRLARKLGVKSGDPGAMYFYADYTEDYAAHLTAEQINDKGVWENPRGRANHLWDCEVMAMAAYDFLVGVGHIAVLQPPPEGRQPEDEQVAARSSYLTGGRR